jgi:tetratricopeptide (TPR) repeat protein
MKLSGGIGTPYSCLARTVQRIGAVAMLLWTCSVTAQVAGPEQLFQEAVAAQQRGDDAVALRDYRELLRLHPEANVVRVNLGATLAHLGKFNEAIDQYRAVLATDPGNRAVPLDLALAYQGKGDWQHAMEELEPLHKSDAGDPQAAMMLADCNIHLGGYSKAVSLLVPLESSQPEDLNLEWMLGSALVHAGRTQEGVELIEKVAGKASSADAYLLAGETRLARSEYDLARSDANAALRLNPELAGVETLNGMVLEQMGDYTGAEASLRKAIAADSSDFNAHLYLGAILYFRRGMESARVQLERALQLQPTSVQARYELALVARAEGRMDAALRDLETVVRQSPDWMQPHVELAAVYYRLHRPEDGARERRIVDRMMAAQQEHASAPAP